MRFKPNADRAMADWLRSRFRDSGSFGIVAESDGRPAGFLIGRIDLWESAPPILEPRKMGIIDAIYVVDEFRRRRIATMMIERAMEIMRSRNAVAVETTYDAWSDASAETWRRAGFAPWMVHAYRML
ncbi:MAG: GNAT family N-acetyltransferase [Acidobacteria bacterium]|nr:GNAT family N-acetyltransferase [Acidobacteriota bacterium]